MNIKRIVYKVIHFINPLTLPTYGPKIFQQKSWLTRQTEEAIYQQSKAQVYQTR